jgi:hypothetical protein
MNLTSPHIGMAYRSQTKRVIQFGHLAGLLVLVVGVILIVTAIASVLPLLPSVLAGVGCLVVGAILYTVTNRTSHGASSSTVVWHENRLAGKLVAQTAPRIGLDEVGVRIPGAFGMEAMIPWEDLHGPTRQSPGKLWKIFPSKANGECDQGQYCVVNQEVARAIASHPECTRRSMTKGDIRALELGK